MKPGISPKYWSPEEHARLLHLRDVEGKEWPEIAAELGRTASAVQSRYVDNRNGVGVYRQSTKREGYDAAAAAREATSALSHGSVTAAFFGDPLPGRPALDRRQHLPDIRTVSLAGGTH